jgi:hypothetical protein
MLVEDKVGCNRPTTGEAMLFFFHHTGKRKLTNSRTRDLKPLPKAGWIKIAL